MSGAVWMVACLLWLLSPVNVHGAWKYSRKTRKGPSAQYQNDAAAYGPNVCAVQEVFKTGEKFYPDCVRKRIKKVCGTPTFVRYECCCGFGAMDVQPTKNIRETLTDLGVTEFTKLLKNTELEYKLRETGAFTVFAPIDKAFESITQDQRQRVFPWTYNALSLLHYHVAPGWHHSDHFRGLQLLPSLYYGLKPLSISGRSKQDMHTVNCARLIKGNILASNGVIHLIDQVLQTFDLFGNITDVMFRQTEQFSQFIQVLYTAEMFPMLRADGPFTVFAPSNYAFSRLPKLVLERVLREQKTAEAVIMHHTAPRIYCASANVDKTSVTMLDGSKQKMSCKKSGQFLHNSQIVKADLLAGNGVVHIINKIQLPNFVKTLDVAARDLHVTKFLQLAYEMGLLDKLQTDTEMTLFAPSDKAFGDMPKNKRRELFSDPLLFTTIFDYALTIGKIRTENFVGDSGIIMNSGSVLKLAIHKDGILVDDAAITSPDHECSNGVVHVIDKVLYPPTDNIYNILHTMDELRFSIFRKGVEVAGLDGLLSDSDRSLTVFVPTDQAFAKLPQWHLDELFDDSKKLKMHIQNHIVNRYVEHRSIAEDSVLLIESMQGERLLFQRAKDKYMLNTYSDILDSPIFATNGVIYVVDRVFECACKTDPS
ncbi:POSTN-like protein [Mya arenaria]|uniref:POSTN-like protein n=1 Tax=Mya arenaria TaxID=6604 RepID=A0ABY7DTM4_MYAAR|nr:POSTN-like protein [Mya arenaria]